MKKIVALISLLICGLLLSACGLFGSPSGSKSGATLDISNYDGLWTGSFTSTLSQDTQDLELSAAVNQEENFVRFQLKLAGTIIMVFFANFDEKQLTSDEVTFSNPENLYQDLSYVLNAQDKVSGQVSDVPQNADVTIGKISFSGSFDFSAAGSATIEVDFFDAGGATKIGTGTATLSKN